MTSQGNYVIKDLRITKEHIAASTNLKFSNIKPALYSSMHYSDIHNSSTKPF